MPVLNLNGVSRKNAAPVSGTIFGAGVAAHQHRTLDVRGKTYNSPFTESSANLFPTGQTVSTQQKQIPLNVQSPGQVVPLKKFVKVHPNEKGSTFSTTVPARPIVGRVGGPSKHANTPANPNAPHLKQQPRPQRAGSQTPTEKTTNMSFLRSGGTIGAHGNPDAGTSSHASRWSVTKKGAAG